MVIPTRAKGGTLQLDGKLAGWSMIAGPFTSVKEATEHIKSKKVVHGDNGGEWACNQTGCKQWRHCNRHDKCPVQLSIRGTAGSQYCNIYVTEGVAHTLTPKAYARRNSPLSFEEAAQVQGWVEGGKKPKEMKELVQRKRIAQGESGELPPAQKLPEGGIAGISPKTLEPCASSCNPVLHAAWNA